jgi:uncharacterized membrane protein YuzA (DUF378 family)
MFTNTSYGFLTSITLFLSSVGAINWGLIAGFDFNLVEFLFGSYPPLVKITYALVGLSGLYSLFPFWKMSCSAKG